MLIAVDVGGTKIAAALVDAGGNIIRKVKLPTGTNAVSRAAEAARQVASSFDGIDAVGVAVPGIYYAATGRVWAPNVPGWDHILLRQELETLLPVPIVVDSDRAACVLGEQWKGAAQGCTDVVFLAVGTGIGAGILSGGRLIRGASDIAGAVGWFALNPEKNETYRKVGCWEAESAGPGLARRLGARNAEEVVEAARRGDAAALRAIEETSRYLGMGIANLISILNPQVVVLGGGLMQASDLMLDTIRREVREWAQPIAAGQVRIEATRLGEDAALIGAARLALDGVA